MNQITDASPASATPLGVHNAAREALASAEQRQAIADVLDYLDRHRGELCAPRPATVAVKDPQAIAAILDHHDARRPVLSASPVPVAVLLDSHAGAR